MKDTQQQTSPYLTIELTEEDVAGLEILLNDIVEVYEDIVRKHGYPEDEEALEVATGAGRRLLDKITQHIKEKGVTL
jgi:hypothetical protein